MARIKLTKKTVDALPAPDPSGRQKIHWDAELRGFGVLCSGTTNAKSYVAQRDLPDGRTRRVTIAATNEMDLDEARRRAGKALVGLRDGIDPKVARAKERAAGLTLRGALDDYLAASKGLREKSRKSYRSAVERYLAAWLDWPIRSITPAHVRARHTSIKQEIEERHAAKDGGNGRYHGDATANGTMRALRALWNHVAKSAPDMPANPVGQLRGEWYPVPRRDRLVSGDQLPAFYKAITELPNPVHRDYLLLLLFTGLRREEAAGLRWVDVDFSGRLIRMPAARTKGGRKLDLPMSDFVRNLLVVRGAAGREEFVFPADSKSGYIAEPKFPLRQVQAATGIEVSAHDLRRTFITVAESTDMSVMALKALVNHSAGGDVTAGYVSMSTDRLRDPAQRVCDRLKELCSIIPIEENTARLAE